MSEKSNVSDIENSEGEEREKWDKKAESILSMLGFCVGLGNIWRFPYLVMRNGGGAFLIPFVFFLLMCGLPLYFLEVALGQFSGKGIVKVWDVCPLFRGVGFGICILSSISCTYYIVIICWTLYYLAMSFTSPVPWTLCGQEWNTNICASERTTVANTSAVNTTENLLRSSQVVTNQTQFMTSEEEFWQENVLHLSSGLHEIGKIQWHLALCFLAAWIMVCLCIIKGVKSVGKVVYVTATMPYILLIVILIRGLTLPGAIDGIRFYVYPDFEKIMKVGVWVEAAIQIFYSSGIVWGALITMASFNKFRNNCLRDSVCLVIAGEGTSIFGGFVIFSILGFMAHEANVPIEEVVKSGPGLGFIAYPEALAKLPLPNLWSVVFFITLLTVGLDSTFGTIEPVCTALTDSFPILRKRRAIFTAALSAVCFLVGLPMVTEGGIYVFQLVDWYSASIAVPLFGCLECLVIGWIYGAEMFSRDVEMMIGRGIPVVMRVCWCIVTPLILFVTMVFTLATYKPPTYGDYHYPQSAEVFGWIIALVPIVPIPVIACVEIWKAEGFTLAEKLRETLRPNKMWLPNDKAEKTGYLQTNTDFEGGFLQRMSMNLKG